MLTRTNAWELLYLTFPSSFWEKTLVDLTFYCLWYHLLFYFPYPSAITSHSPSWEIYSSILKQCFSQGSCFSNSIYTLSVWWHPNLWLQYQWVPRFDPWYSLGSSDLTCSRCLLDITYAYYLSISNLMYTELENSLPPSSFPLCSLFLNEYYYHLYNHVSEKFISHSIYLSVNLSSHSSQESWPS